MKCRRFELHHTSVVLLVSFLVLFQLNCAEPTPQEQARRVLEDAAEAMGGLEALRGVENITRRGNRQANSLGQARVTAERLLVGSPGPYTQIIDFTVPREVNLSGEREIIQVADAQKGGYRDVQGRALRPLEPGQMEGYQIEWDRDIVKFLVHALGDESSIEDYESTTLDDQRVHVAHVRFIDGTLYKVTMGHGTDVISKLEFTEERNPYGDVAKERRFSNYLEVGGLTLPFTETTREMGEVTRILEWSEITINQDLPEERFEIPTTELSIRERAQALLNADTLPVEPTELAPGVYFGESVSMNNMWVEFDDFILVAEGPSNELQSLEVIRQIRETVGDKPIRYLVTTHHHADHTGGIRTYAGEGAIVVTHANNEAIIREILTRPHTLKPDLLAKSQQEPQIETVEDRKTITDGTRTVELVHVPNSHADGYLAIYLPRERLIFQSDMLSILQGETGEPVLRPYTREFYDAVVKEGWRVDRIVPGHGRLTEWKELADALERAE
ncbi:MAG: MBL fold metallo-hydrolase [Acidobacteria bacterium]|nr:MBL fold metallo-hydrolase [Acidobacteriota bacterium]